MLFTKDALDGIAAGRITVAVRRWKRPTVRAGGTLVTPVGVLDITEVRPIEPRDLSTDDARAAGFATRDEALDSPHLRREGALHLVRFSLAGEDPRIALRQRDELPDEELVDVLGRLRRLDTRSRRGAWTEDVLRAIATLPGVRAADLAGAAGLDTAPFKADVRKLKALGLTESLEVGYRLSPRGRTILAALDAG
ncbi:MAG: hypothetical protein ACOYOP_09670 [Microthrixaceae bacterium]